MCYKKIAFSPFKHIIFSNYKKQTEEVEMPFPLKKEGILACDLSINPLKKSLNIKDRGNGKTRRDKSILRNTQEIHEFNGNVYVF